MNVVRFLIFLSMTVYAVAASSDDIIAQKDKKIEHLKRELAIKKQEIQILLIAIKNQKQEQLSASNEQALEFDTVKKVSPTRVVLKPSMLSEEAISAIDRTYQTDTDTLTQQMQNISHNNQDSGDELTIIDDTQAVEDVAQSAPQQNPDELKLEYTTPKKYYMRRHATVYKDLGRTPFANYKEGKSFTSNRKKGDWILITGQITNKGWQAAKQEIWVHKSNVR